MPSLTAVIKEVKINVQVTNNKDIPNIPEQIARPLTKENMSLGNLHLSDIYLDCFRDTTE